MVRAEQISLAPGMIVWAELDPTIGKEQAGRRPVIVISNDMYLDAVTDLVIVMPITTTNRGWANHIAVSPADLLNRPSWIMTEQVRTISRHRIHRILGTISTQCLADIRQLLGWFTQ